MNYVLINDHDVNELFLPKLTEVIWEFIKYELNNENEVNKSAFFKYPALRVDNRTYNKYWKGLVQQGLLVKTDKPKVWLVNPDYMRHQHLNVKECEERWETFNESAS